MVLVSFCIFSNCSSDNILYAPELPVATWGGNNLFLACGPRDQSVVDDRTDVLVFTSDPLQKPLAITGNMSPACRHFDAQIGRVTANLWVSSSAQDTDFVVKLMDVYPASGSSMLIVDGIIRMKWRNSTTTPTPITPNTIYSVQIDLWSTSWIFPTGHKISIAVTSSNYPRQLFNFQITLS
jgi:putative CocE/NonD family hydrolase